MNDLHALPVLRVSIDSMRHTLLQVLEARHDDLVACVNAGIDAAISELPNQLAREAKQLSQDVVRKALEKALEDYWNSGPGREQLDTMIAKRFK